MEFWCKWALRERFALLAARELSSSGNNVSTLRLIFRWDTIARLHLVGAALAPLLITTLRHLIPFNPSMKFA